MGDQSDETRNLGGEQDEEADREERVHFEVSGGRSWKFAAGNDHEDRRDEEGRGGRGERKLRRKEGRQRELPAIVEKDVLRVANRRHGSQEACRKHFEDDERRARDAPDPGEEHREGDHEEERDVIGQDRGEKGRDSDHRKSETPRSANPPGHGHDQPVEEARHFSELDGDRQDEEERQNPRVQELRDLGEFHSPQDEGRDGEQRRRRDEEPIEQELPDDRVLQKSPSAATPHRD